MIKSKRRALRNKRESNAVEATVLRLETKSGLQPNSMISPAHINGQLPAGVPIGSAVMSHRESV